MTLSASGVPSSMPPLPATAYLVTRPISQRPERLSPSGVPSAVPPLPASAYPRPLPGSPVRPDDSIQTMMFILRNFQAHYKRWPANMAEVKAFANDTANFQPEFPETYDNPLFDNAVFTTSPDGGLRINYQNGSMNLAKPK